MGLRFAFHPQYASTGRFYVYFTNSDGDIRIVRYSVSGDPDVANQSSAADGDGYIMTRSGGLYRIVPKP